MKQWVSEWSNPSVMIMRIIWALSFCIVWLCMGGVFFAFITLSWELLIVAVIVGFIEYASMDAAVRALKDLKNGFPWSLWKTLKYYSQYWGTNFKEIGLFMLYIFIGLLYFAFVLACGEGMLAAIASYTKAQIEGSLNLGISLLVTGEFLICLFMLLGAIASAIAWLRQALK